MKNYWPVVLFAAALGLAISGCGSTKSKVNLFNPYQQALLSSATQDGNLSNYFTLVSQLKDASLSSLVRDEMVSRLLVSGNLSGLGQVLSSLPNSAKRDEIAHQVSERADQMAKTNPYDCEAFKYLKAAIQFEPDKDRKQKMIKKWAEPVIFSARLGRSAGLEMLEFVAENYSGPGKNEFLGEAASVYEKIANSQPKDLGWGREKRARYYGVAQRLKAMVNSSSS